MSVTHLVTQSFSNGRATPFQTRFSSCWYTPGYTHNFKWSGNMRLNIHFQSVRRHGNTLVFKKFGHPVTHSFSNGRDTSGYTLVFERLSHPATHSFSNDLVTSVYTLVFKWLCHTQITTCFQMVGKHPVTHSFLNGWDRFGYTVVFKCPGHIRLHPRF